MSFSDADHKLYQKIIAGINYRRTSGNTEEFSIPDLVSTTEWNSCLDKSKLIVGKRFKVKVDLNEIRNVVFCRKNKKEWAVYKIIL